MSTLLPARPLSGPARDRHAAPNPPRAGRCRPDVYRVLSRVIIAVLVVVQVYPLVWLFLSSVRTEKDFASANPFGLPTSFTLDNFARAFDHADLGRYILNSLVVTLGADALIVVCGLMGAYAIQVLGFRLSNVVRGLFLLGIVVPVQIALVPLFIDYAQVGLLDTYPAMMIPLAGFGLPMSIYLFSSFFSYIPREMYEAASLDGAGPYRIFARMTLPLSVNTIVTVVMVNSIFIWNDFVFANTFVLSEGLKTIPVGLQNYIGAMGKTDWTATFAGVCVTVTPLLLVFLVLNKAMIYGLESGATKG
ncbi:carbohydrate ABC transporter permease [Streptomyces sp. NPDC005480]|uniref:carbohydrate ABC transporter permease n=1 Tax=Streptomyces sp. NPDC005480 TaxID=3154880 RepID=UPI0033A725C0